MLQIRSHSTSTSSSCANRSRRLLREPQQLRELVRVEVALVEQLLGRLDDRGDDPRLADDAAGRAHRAAADLRRDRPDLERELRRAGERVAPLVHRRRAGVRRLAAPRDLVALDAERPEHDAEREVHRLEHRPLLDVQLEIRGGVLELRARRRARGRGRRRARAARPASATPSRVPALPQLVLVGHRARSRARAEERAPEARPLLVGPVHEPDGQRRRPLLRDPPQHLDAGHHVQRRRRASRRSAPSRCGRRSAAPAPIAPRSVNHWFPASSISSSRAGLGDLRRAASPARCSHVSVQATRCAPFSSPVSSRSSRSSSTVLLARAARADSNRAMW